MSVRGKTSCGGPAKAGRHVPSDNTAVIRSGRGWPILAGCALLSAMLSAHEVPVEQRIDMSMQRQGDRFVVRMRVPVALLGDAPIQIAAADAARNLDVRQNDAPLPAPALSAVTGRDRVWTDIELTYRIDANANGISARLNGFRTPPMQPLRTTVRYQPPNGRAQVLSIVGPAARVHFDPSMLDTVQEFLARSLRAVLTLGDHLLLLACLLMPMRSARDAARLFGAFAAGQAIGMAVFGLPAAPTAVFTQIASLVAASAVVVAAVQNMVSARYLLVAALSVGVGVLNGVAFGDVFATGRQFAGAHQAAAFAVFLAVAIAGEFWIGAVMWAARAWLDRRGAPIWMLTIVASAFIAHSAIHEVLDRGQALATEGAVAVDAVFWVTMAWAIVMLGVALVEWLRQLGISGRAGTAARSLSR
jgi:hypothetical protein